MFHFTEGDPGNSLKSTQQLLDPTSGEIIY